MSITPQTEQNTILVIRHAKGALPPARSPLVQGTYDLTRIAQLLEAAAHGGQAGAVDVEVHRGSTSGRPLHAGGLLTMATSSGTVGVIINGVTITVTWATSDANSQTLLAAAIRASSNALVQGLVTACNLAAAVTCASVVAGDYVEIQDAKGCKTQFLAVSGKPAARGEFLVGGTDAATATNLAAAVNAHPAFAGKLVAFVSSATVTLRQMIASTASKYTLITSHLTRLLLTGSGKSTAMVANANTLIWALQKGKIGNCITIAASGTNVTASGARLTGGVGGDSTSPAVFQR